MFKKYFFKTAQALVMQPLYRQTRGLTIGTRTMVVRPSGEVLLIRHTYAPGWLFPGGGVERGETIYKASVREVSEESGVVPEEEPVLHGVFLNDAQFPGDHIACFVLRKFSEREFRSNLEIAEARFFAPDQLPVDTTRGTRMRIGEVLNGTPPARIW